GRAAGSDAGRVGRPVAAVPRVPGAVRLQLRRPDDDLRHLRRRAARLVARGGRAVRPRRTTAGTGRGLLARGRLHGDVPVRRRRRLAAGRPRRPGTGHRCADQHPRRVPAGPPTRRTAARRLHQQRVTRARALPRRRRGGPARAAGALPHRLGVRLPDDRLRARRRRHRPAAGELAAHPGRAGLAEPAGPRASGTPARLRRRRPPAGRPVGPRRPLRLARPVPGRRRLRHRQPPGRRAADPRPQRHRHRRLARPAHLTARAGSHGRCAGLHRRRRRHPRRALLRFRAAAVHRGRGDRFRLRRGLLRRGRHHHRRRGARAQRRAAGQRLRRRLPRLQPPLDRGRHRRRGVRADPDDGGLQRRRRPPRPAGGGRPAPRPTDRRHLHPRRAVRGPRRGAGRL
ncbi:MAG: Uncharacterized MFS-type transporter, partial [uncultured Blastococcus sp.]